ncbi:adenosylcobinamide-GDP ribazoletransferase [Heyndrickxia oleronia]|uniref:Adenosylcobinamide-GDP ribazoletransferase n=1 Tax=Heyndrickxia oleronia TaxID=38875 RepID=A0AAW6SP87_9BACI|nr:adenosylcobinamide-GDP ribazoletransferase [Heyndrickxia oleronia]MDH5160630.1 adenosylcobinamide-GDP ribazoletransferase [Heyndrickxia oleronia]
MTNKMKKIIDWRGPIKGMLINLQFFTIVPIPYELPMDKKHMTYAVKFFPLLGLFQGAIFVGALYLLTNYTPFSTLATAFILWLLTIIVTGGLHIDGWMDASDAFFSYQQIDKRLEIMKDPRTGAFGVISVIILLSGRFLFIYEIIHMLSTSSFIFIFTLPFLSKSLMGYLLLNVPAAKQEGLGHFFQKSVHKNALFIYPFYILLYLVFVILFYHQVIEFVLLLILITLLAGFFFKRKIIKWFSGITGDVLGASVEGVEWILWMSIWLLHYFATV